MQSALMIPAQSLHTVLSAFKPFGTYSTTKIHFISARKPRAVLGFPGRPHLDGFRHSLRDHDGFRDLLRLHHRARDLPWLLNSLCHLPGLFCKHAESQAQLLAGGQVKTGSLTTPASITVVVTCLLSMTVLVTCLGTCTVLVTC
jgi:hypothetical protein